MKRITIQRMKKQDGYKWYPRQNGPQPCELRLNSDGRVLITYNSEIGNAVSEARWHGREHAWTFPYPISCTTGNRVMRQLKSLLQEVFTGTTIRWDGSNHVGELSSEAHIASESIDLFLKDLGEGFADPAYDRECELRG